MIIQVLLAAVAGAVTLFVLGYLIWGVLLGSYFRNNAIEYAGLNKLPTPNLVLLFLSNLALALLLAFVFAQWASIRTFGGGLVAGAIVGSLIHLSWKLSMTGYMNLYKKDLARRGRCPGRDGEGHRSRVALSGRFWG